MKYKNKVIWITGASSGIGEHLAYAFAEQGAKIVLSSRKTKELERVKNNCSGTDDILILPLDVAAFDTIAAATEKVINTFQQIDMLINNAGISQRELAAVTDLSVDQKIMDVNYLGTIAVTKSVLPHMIAQKSGQIVVISSVMGKFGTPYRSAYSASKHALHGFFDSLRAEVDKDNISVTIICPGYVHTNVTINALRGDGSKNNEMATATRNGLEPGDFARKALRVISREKEEALIGKKEVLAVYVKRFFPAFFSRMVKRVKVT